MPFSPEVKDEALLKSRRACCLCREFAGLYINVHHIEQEAQGGSNDIENAIALCLRCHGEVGHYNTDHPIGKKYKPEELRAQRDEFWELCRTAPHIPLPVAPIRVSPAYINLSTGIWKSINVIDVHNSSRRMYYQICMKLGLNNSCISWDNIKIEWLEPKWTIFAKLDPFLVSSDIFRITGSDNQGNKATYLWLHSLRPGQIHRFRVTIQEGGAKRVGARQRIITQLLAFDVEPTRILEAPNRVAFPFTAPEDIGSVETASVMLRRKSNTVDSPGIR